MKQYNLRFHHVMCMHTYSGTGYSKKFSEKMEQLITDCQQFPETSLLLIDHCDDLCSACPHRRADGCKEEASIIQRDQEVREYFGLQKGRLTYNELIQQIHAAFSEIKTISQVCHTCRFYPLCDAVLPKTLLSEQTSDR